jgi:hypothetical protein
MGSLKTAHFTTAPFRTARWPGLLVGTVLLGTGLPAANAADPDTGWPVGRDHDGATLWDTVKADTQQLATIGNGVVRSLVAWLSGLDGGSQSQLATDLLTFTSRDLRDLEVLVDQAGYRLDEIIIHPGDPGQPDAPADVTLSFTGLHPIDARHQADLRSIVAANNALVDDDTRTIVGALLEAAAHAGTGPSPDRFRLHKVHVRLGHPATVVVDVREPRDHPADGSILLPRSDALPPGPATGPEPAPDGLVPMVTDAARAPPERKATPVTDPARTPEPATTVATPAPALPALAPPVQPGPEEPVKPAGPLAGTEPAAGQSYRVVGATVNGHAGPGLHQPVIRKLTPADRLHGTGNRHQNWIEVTLDGVRGTAARLWVYDGMVMPGP